MITRKILEKVATFTTYPGFHEEDDSASESIADSTDPELIHATGSDSSGDSKVVAKSVDGEEGIVDVSMKGQNGPSETVDEETAKSGDAEPKYVHCPPTPLPEG